jgi:hypothetical protein
MNPWEENERYCKHIEDLLPKIDGIEWQVLIDRSYSSPGYQIRVVSSFMVDDRGGLQDKLPEILEKIHQVVSNGQVKLELE